MRHHYRAQGVLGFTPVFLGQQRSQSLLRLLSTRSYMLRRWGRSQSESGTESWGLDIGTREVNVRYPVDDDCWFTGSARYPHLHRGCSRYVNAKECRQEGGEGTVISLNTTRYGASNLLSYSNTAGTQPKQHHDLPELPANHWQCNLKHGLQLSEHRCADESIGGAYLRPLVLIEYRTDNLICTRNLPISAGCGHQHRDAHRRARPQARSVTRCSRA